MRVKSRFFTLPLIFTIFASTNVLAKENNYNWIIRARAIHVKTDINSKVSTLGGNVAANSDTVPELDFTRFFTPNIAAELILATTKHDMSLNASALGARAGLGSVKLLPPTLTMQYHFIPKGTIRPYVGAGLNYTFFYGAKNGGVATNMKYKDNFGYALQAGFDYMITDRVGINFDIKKIFLRTKVIVNNAYTAKAELNPWIIGGGISYRF